MRSSPLVAVMILLFLPASVAQAAGEPASILDIQVVQDKDFVRVEIMLSQPVTPVVVTAERPERLVLVLPGTVSEARQKRIPVGAAGVKAVRMGLHSAEPPETHVVVDLEAERNSHAVDVKGRKIVLVVMAEHPTSAARRNVPAGAGSVSPLVDIFSKRKPLPTATEPSRNAAPPKAAKVEGVIPPAEAVIPAPTKPAVEPSGSAAQPEPIKVEEANSRPPAMPAEIAVTPRPREAANENVEHEAVAPAAEAKINEEPPPPETAEVAGNAQTDSRVGESEPVVQPAALGAGVTGKAKDATLGSDEEAAIKATIPSDKHLPAPRNGEGSVPVALALSGTATAGYYEETTKNGYASREASPVGSVRFDASGFVHSPGFLNFTVKPQGSLGRASSEGVFPDGEGVSAGATLFGGGVTPLTVSYYRLNRKVVTFGPLDRLAGLEANSFQDSLGANWEIRVKKLPELHLNYSNYSDSYDPLAALAPATANSGRLLSADLTDTVLGWNLQARYKQGRSSQDLINIFDPTQAPYLYKRNDQDVRASADRQFGDWLSTSLVAGTTKSRNEVQDRPFDQSFRFLTSNSFFRAGQKLTLAFHMGLTDNVVGAFLDRVTGGDGLTPAQPIVWTPTTARLRMTSYSGSAQYALTRDLRVQTDVLRETTSAPENSSIASSASELTSVQAGISFVHRFRRWQFQSYYAANGGRFDYATTGSSRTTGQRADLSATIGSLQSLEMTASVHGSLQNIGGNTNVYDRSAGASISLSHVLRERWRLRATYDRERDQYMFSSTQFSSVGNGISIAVVHPLVELTAAHSLRDGLTFQADPRLQFVPPGQSGLLLGAFPGTLVVPTGADWNSAALSFHPVSKLTGRVGWLNNRQKLQGAISNYYTEWEASVGYKFRSITVDAGYVEHSQDFGMALFMRNRFFFRLVREFTVY